MTDVDVVINLQSRLGEGPVWDHRTDLLSWVDILGGFVHHTHPVTGATHTVPVGAPVGALGLLGDDGHLLALRNGFAPLIGSTLAPLTEAFHSDGLRMNDGAVDPAGRFLAGSMGDGAAPVGSLYSRDTDGTVRSLFGDVTISNGIGWSHDGALMYYVDSATQAIDVLDYDVDSGTVSGRRRWVEIPVDDGTPDGLTVDAEGCVWVALWDGGQVRRYSPDGDLVAEIRVPVARATSCAFGGPDLDRLFITTAAVGIDPRTPEADLAGAVFVAEPGCIGVAAQVIPTA